MIYWDELPFFKSAKFKEVLSFVEYERQTGTVVLPPKRDIFKAFVTTPLDEVKVVILGQDPYPTETPRHAMGLSFSVVPEIKKLPKSLINIFTELKGDLGIVRTNGDLTDWAKQGVLLLNTSLTVAAGKPGSHSKVGWHILTDQAIRAVSEHRKNVVFILWGNHAKMKRCYIDNTERHLIIESVHPSPLSAYNGFFGSKPFSKCNQFLLEHGIDPISW